MGIGQSADAVWPIIGTTTTTFKEIPGVAEVDANVTWPEGHDSLPAIEYKEVVFKTMEELSLGRQLLMKALGGNKK